ncbi:MAG: BtpA/SgcQ family protein [Desulfurococcaceae archaeon]
MSGLFKEVIGVIHLPRLPCLYAKSSHDLSIIVEQAVNEARILEKLGYSGVIVENYGDKPYLKRVRDPLIIASMSIIVKEVVRSTGLKVGVNLLRNSGREAYSIAYAAGAKFIRVNALVETIVSDSGIIEPEAPRLKPLLLNYPGVEVYADIFVKHAFSLRALALTTEAPSYLLKGSREDFLREIIEDYVNRGGASALIVTGPRTSEPPQLELIKLVKNNSSVPVFSGSGANPSNICAMLKYCDGVIVGSFLKKNGLAGNPLDPERAEVFIRSAKECIEK